ncbi:hypothetical protein EYZ11_010354 [Aspergillus tanneri]|uniref:Uncharacterized protein n=1 Tax=Aspergillus tanneri TaxID=1220188 RepID=A0A4S3J7P9_9EURO|nr:hypothetical protein EYZ11_010354 [Aspergillus tanneri]
MLFTFYYYEPSAPAAVIFLVLFGLSTILHFHQLIQTRTWFMIPFLIGGILETIGYAGRLLSHNEFPNFTKGPYVIQSALILIAPAFFAASIYMTLGRIIAMLQAEQYSIVRLHWLTKIFVAGDVLSFLMQASGAGIMVKDSTDPNTGERIIIGGLFVQIIMFTLFVITAAVFEIRMARGPLCPSSEVSGVWRPHMVALYVTSTMILVRSIIRVVEYLDGYDGYLMRHEVFLYVFDALLMFLPMVILNGVHPSEINCLLGRGDKYIRRFIKTHKSVDRPLVEMQNPIDV